MSSNSNSPSPESWLFRLNLFMLSVLLAFCCFLLWRISQVAMRVETVIAQNTEEITQIAKTAANVSKELDRAMQTIESLEESIRGSFDPEMFQDMMATSVATEAEDGGKLAEQDAEAILALLDRIRESGLRFGYDNKEFSAHRMYVQLNIKFRTFRRDLASVDEFIDRVATKTINGHTYSVIEKDGTRKPLPEWLRSQSGKL